MQEEIKKLTDILKTMKSTSVGYSEEKVSEDTLMYFEEGAKNTTFVIMDSRCPSSLVGRGIIVKEQVKLK